MFIERDSPEFEDLSVAVAHWHVRSWGSAEYLVTRLAEALGRDRVYTMGPPDPDSPNPFGDVTFYNLLDRRYLMRRLQRRAGRLFEYALWEDVDWGEYGDFDVLVTSGSTTRAVITPDDLLHVNYCHSPSRWYYDLYHDRKSIASGGDLLVPYSDISEREMRRSIPGSTTMSRTVRSSHVGSGSTTSAMRPSCIRRRRRIVQRRGK
jgi:hypothetical protein